MPQTILKDDQIRQLLEKIVTEDRQPLVNWLTSLKIDTDQVLMIFEAPPERTQEIEALRQKAEAAITAFVKENGMSCKVQSLLTTHRTSQKPTPPPLLAQIKSIIVVASGKGGVGKSTTAANLAIALSQLGQKVGFLDADIYGPSLPRLFSIVDKPAVTPEKKLIPIEKYGISCMSVGFMVPQESALIWRGPMVHGALNQLLKDVVWPELDSFIIDMPPGTGDAHLSICQLLNLTGAIIVSTPQDLALIDARKGINMFQKIGVPVLGIIENMSQFHCPNCGHVSEIFSHGGARQEAQKLEIPFLGELPLDMSIREQSDQGVPITAADPQAPISKIYQGIAQKILDHRQV